jgi:RNase H-fold protein (predicted Holliday junction resolvase)
MVASGFAAAAEWEVEAVVVGLETGESGSSAAAEMVASGFAAAAEWEVEAAVVGLKTGASGPSTAASGFAATAAVVGLETPLIQADWSPLPLIMLSSAEFWAW